MRYNYKGFWNCDSCCDIEGIGEARAVSVDLLSPSEVQKWCTLITL